MLEKLEISSTAFCEGGKIPKRHTGFGEDISPAFHLEYLCKNAQSIAIVLEDLDVPIRHHLTHWIIWNIPVMKDIPEGIGNKSTNVERTKSGHILYQQGKAWGRQCYRGPRQPDFIKKEHTYRFDFYVLDCYLSLSEQANRGVLLREMEKHILQQGAMTGTYKPEKKSG